MSAPSCIGSKTRGKTSTIPVEVGLRHERHTKWKIDGVCPFGPDLIVSVRNDTEDMKGTEVSSVIIDRTMQVGEVWLTVDYQRIVGV